MDAVDDLEITHSCCCTQEPVWSALSAAVSATPDYSNIYIFTDAGGNDANIMESVMADAEAAHVKVNAKLL